MVINKYGRVIFHDAEQIEINGWDINFQGQRILTSEIGLLEVIIGLLQKAVDEAKAELWDY